MPINYGSTRVNDVFYGNKRVLQIYQGSNLVYNAEIGLPEGYVELEYIESTGTQYINTGIYLKGDNWRFKVEYESTDSINNKCLTGIQNGNPLFVLYNGSLYCQPTSTSPSKKVTTNLWTIGHHIIDIKTNGGYVESKLDSTITAYELGTTTSFSDELFNVYPVCVLAYWYTNDMCPNDRKLAAKLYNYRIYNNDKTVCNLVPAMRTSDGTVGMYDLHRRKFLTNSGTGDFIAGPIVKNLPSRYIEVDYLQGDGNSYINTGLILNQNQEIYMKIQFAANTPAMSIFGSREAASKNNIALLLGGSQNLLVDFNNSDYTTYRISTSAVVETDYDIIISKSLRQINTVSSSDLCEDTILSPSTAYLFAISGSPASNNLFTGKIYNCIIKENNSYLQYLVPVFDIVENEYCMYDLVTRTAFRNVGTGAFTGGEIYTNYIGLNNIESIGEKYMNTGIIPNQDYSMELEYEPTQVRTQVLAGTRNVNPNNDSFHINIGNQNTPMIGFDGVSTIGGSDSVTLAKHKVYLTKNSTTYDNNPMTFSSSNFQSTTPIFLFGCNSNNMLILSSKAKIYHCKIWNGKTLVADYLPVIKKSTNEEGFINKIDQSFITWGAEIPTIPSEYLLQDYITFNGSSNYIDTEIVPTDVTNIEVNVRAKASVINSFHTVYGFMNTSSTVTPRMGLHYYNSKYMIGINNGLKGSVTSDTNWHDFKLTTNNNHQERLYVDGTHDKTSSSNDNGFSTNDLSIYLGARHQHDNTVNYFNGEIAHYSYKQNGTMIKDLYPVRRFSDQVYGFYDVVNKEFLPLH